MDAVIVQRISDDAIGLIQAGEILPEDKQGLTQYITDRLLAEYPQNRIPNRLCSFSFLVGAIFGRAVQVVADE